MLVGSSPAVVALYVATSAAPAAEPVGQSAAPALLQKVTAPRRQTRRTALRLKVQISRKARLTLRIRRTGDERRWKPLRLRGREGVNAIRITGGGDRQLPRGRYTVNVTARAGDTGSGPKAVSVRIA
jgi:hypothetical protein